VARSVFALDLSTTFPVRAADGNPIRVCSEHPAEGIHVVTVPGGFKGQREGVVLVFG
jgi:hypothetical protein